MQQLDTFPISLGIDNIDNFQEHKQKIVDITKRKKAVHNHKCNTLKHYYADEDGNILTLSELSYIKNVVETKANDYYQDILGYKENLYI